MVGTVPQKNSEEVIGRYSPTKKGRGFRLEKSHKKVVKRLLVGTVQPKNSEEVNGRNSPIKKIVKRLFVGTIPQKN